jgi:hypothetical protein
VLIVVIAGSTKVMPASSFLPWQPFQPTKMHLGHPYTLWVQLWVLLCRLWTYNRHLVQNPSFHYMSKICITWVQSVFGHSHESAQGHRQGKKEASNTFVLPLQ